VLKLRLTSLSLTSIVDNSKSQATHERKFCGRRRKWERRRTPMKIERRQSGLVISFIGRSSGRSAKRYALGIPPLILLRLGFQTKTASAIMNCIQARDSCMNHTACHPILEVVPRVCGAEKVACSTVTITKCQAALRTLQAFPYFFPTCLCREPSSDPACNTFRDYLFDHPCSIVAEKEKDPYPVHALPTCDYALDVCKKENKCIKLYRDFQTHCKQSDDKCLMQDGEMCHDAWTRLRLSPMFGCICPKVNPKCERIFKEVNYNPCVVWQARIVQSHVCV
ncbi:GDNF family receptor alpha-like, partial [Orchesella cincta]